MSTLSAATLPDATDQPPFSAGEAPRGFAGNRRGVRHALTLLPALARVVLGLTLLAAAGAKLSDLDMAHGTLTRGVHLFAATIAAHHVLPVALALSTAWVTIALEAVLGLWLLSHRRERAAAACALALLLAFSIYLILARVRSGNAACGCFGRVTSNDLSSALARNAALMIAASLTFVRSLESVKPSPTP